MTRSEWRDVVRFATIGDLSSGRVRISLRGSVLTSMARFELCLLVLCVTAISACDDVAGVESDDQRGDVTTRAAPDRSASTSTVGCSAAVTSPVDQVAQQVGRPWAARPLGRLAGHPRSRPVGPVSVLDQGPGDPRWSTTGHAQGCIAGPGSRRLDLRPASVVARELAKRRSRSDGGATSGAVRAVSAPIRNGVARRPRPRRSPAPHQVRGARPWARLEIAQHPRTRLTA
jgi:hypothetical protein